MASLDHFRETIKYNEEDYWLNALAGEPVKTSFPYMNEIPDSNVNLRQREILEFQLTEKSYMLLMKLNNNSDIRLHMILMATLVLLLYKYTENSDILIGTTIYKQNIDAEFINTVLILRNWVNPNITFKELLLQVRQQISEAVENQNYPIERLLQKLEIPFSKNDHFPLFDVAIILENIQDKRYFRDINPNMLFSFACNERTIKGTVGYNASLYERKAIERIITHLKYLLNEVLDNVNLTIDKISILAPEERRELVYVANKTNSEYPRDKTLAELFEAQVEKTPVNIALRESLTTNSITYSGLNEKSNQLARLLRTRGVKTGEIVAIMAGSSAELIVGIMAILKAGGGYLPIDPETPINRTTFMLKDSGVSIILTTNTFKPSYWHSMEDCPCGDIIFIDNGDIYSGCGDNLEKVAGAMDIVYVMFTSGTSGRPKGVIVHHRGVINYINWAIKTYVKEEKADFPLYTSISFDLTVTSIFVPLLTGNSIVVYSGEYKELLIGNIIDDNTVGVVKITPSHLKLLGEREAAYPGADQEGTCKNCIKRFVVGGEEFKSRLAKKTHDTFEGQIEIYNEYGPTETVVGSMIYKYNPTRDNRESVPIGIPIYNTQVYILDNNRMPVPVTVTGEIYISGDGVSRGYLNRPELTFEKFLKNPFVPGKRMYRTGDMGRWIDAGKMEFLGRIDSQLKIRGYRIEPEEIEGLLLKKDEIKEAIVVVRDDAHGDESLCVYIVSDEEVDLNKLKEYLTNYFPHYMVPAYIMQIRNIPLTPNGKLDRKALPTPLPIRENTYAIPRNKVEKMLAEIWESVLGIENIGVNDNFFAIGGDSIKTIQIVSRVKKNGYKIEMRDIFQEPSIAKLAPLLKKTDKITDQAVVIGPVPLTPVQRWFFETCLPVTHHYNQAVMLYSREGFEVEAVKAVFSKLIEHHDALRMIYTCDKENISQYNQGLDSPVSIEVYDFRNWKPEDWLKELAQKTQAINTSIDLEKGQVMKTGLFHMDDGDRLLIVIHHLVIDGVSWRILFEDIGTLYRHYKKGESLVLPLKTDSFKTWAERLSEYANSKTFLKEKPYWTELEAKEIPLIKKDFEENGNYFRDSEGLSMALSEDATKLLLTKVNEAFATEINDILLTALGLAIKKIYGHNRLAVLLEGHGREEILEGIDVSRTVGWFTSIFPVLLDFSYECADAPNRNLDRQIKEVKESLRRIPNKGVGYGILKYLTSCQHKTGVHFQLHPQISFNYLGQFDTDIRQSSFEIAKEKVGHTVHPDTQKNTDLSIVGMISDNRLEMTITYSKNHFTSLTIQAVIDQFKTELQHIISYCSAQKNTHLSPSDLTYNKLSIDTLDALIAGIGKDGVIDDIYALSPMQEGLLFHSLVEKGKPGIKENAYFEQMSYRVRGELDIAFVKKSIDELVKRHDILRTVFVYEGVDFPAQIVLKEKNIDFYFKDIRSTPAIEDRYLYIKEFLAADREHSFDLSRDTLMRFSVIQLGDTEYQLTWSFHHIIMDGWCTLILIEEFLEIYNSYLEKRAYRLSVATPYRAYIKWLATRDKEESKQYWSEYLLSYEDLISVPQLRNHSLEEGDQKYKHEVVHFAFTEKQISGLNQLIGNYNVTLNTAFLTLWGIMLGKYNNVEDVVFGEVVSGRPIDIVGVESMVGLFINTVPVRIRWEEEAKFSDLLKQVQEEAIDSEPHHYYPLSEIQNESTLKKNLFDQILAFENFPMAETIEGLTHKKAASTEGNIKFKISHVEIFERTHYNFNVIIAPGNCLAIRLEYNGYLYENNFVTAIPNHFVSLIEQILTNEQAKINELELLSEQEKKNILHDFNNMAAEYPNEQTIYEIFAKQAEKTPGHVALIGQTLSSKLQRPNNSLTPKDDNICITYAELNCHSHQLADILLQKGAGSDTLVAVFMERSVEMVIGILAVLKAGAAYLPVESDFPGERIKYILLDSGAKILLNDWSELPSWLDSEPNFAEQWSIVNYQLSVNSKPVARSSYPLTVPHHLAYIIYTSGTTGTPKGVLIEHRNVVRLLFNNKYPFDFTSNDIWTMFHSYCFDFSVWEMYGPLLYGGRLVVIPRMVARDPGKYLEVLKDEKVTILNQTPSAFYNLAKEELKQSTMRLHLRYVIFGGEALKPVKLNDWKTRYPVTKLINMFGITETTVHVTYKEISAGEIQANISNIGIPIPTLSTYILDRYLNLMPIGLAGELCVGGQGIGRGYLNRPDLTEMKFIENPFSSRGKLYRSGDLARIIDQREIEYLGRIDHQVKIRGYRIETGEIEARLLTHQEIKEAVVIARQTEEGENYLCAYYVSEKKLTLKDLREFLSLKLPQYMIPANFVPLMNLPLTPVGKIDRKALPVPEGMKLESGVEYLLPRNEVERMLVETWQKVLGRDGISINDNFFEIGGDSIKTIQIAARIKKAGYEIYLKDIFENPQISQLAPLVRKLERIPDQGIITGSVALTPIQHWFFERQLPDNNHFNQAVMFYSREGFEVEALKAIFLKLQQHHDALRMTYNIHNRKILQEIHGLEYPFSFQVFDIRDHKDAITVLESTANQIQASIDLKTGPLMKLGLFRSADGDRLLIVIHHLVVDGVSWRILFEDLGTLYHLYKKGSPLSLPLKTDSFKEWSAHLSRYANSESFLKERAYWAGVGSLSVPKLEKELPEENKNSTGTIGTKSLSFNLSKSETALFLTKVNEAFRTDSNDILLTALALSLKKIWGHQRFLIALEGHGRQEIIKDIDVSRTIGWFTTVYPIILDVSYENDLPRQIKEIKETLRRVPNKGIGYGAMKYLTVPPAKEEIQFRLKPQISFNYLGQFDEDIKHISIFEIAKESAGKMQSSRNKGEYELNISAMIINESLIMTIAYNNLHFKPETMAALTTSFESELKHIVSFCSSKQNIEFSPSDFTYKGLTIETVNRLMREYPTLEDLYLLTPMQEGMLFHAVTDRNSAAYFEQFSFNVQGTLDVINVKKSLGELSRRHDVLRTAFIYEGKGIERPLQLVLKDRQVELFYENLSNRRMGNGNVEELETLLETFKRRDRERSFELSKDVLMRLAILQLNSDEYELIWSHHHILMDGWCTGILITEFFEIYNSNLEKIPFQLTPLKPYRMYIQWLEKQDKELSGRYWAEYLEGYDVPAVIPQSTFRESGRGNDIGYNNQHVSLIVDSEKTKGLNLLAARNNVTLNILLQTIWGIILGKYSDKQDVVYGAVVSGRPPEIEGVESMVGLFINTIPIRIYWQEKTKFSSLLQRRQREAIDSEPHNYYPLAEIQSASGMHQTLLDHIIVFENYPLAAQIDGLIQNREEKISPFPLKISRVGAFEQTNYNFNIIVQPGNQLTIQFSYNGFIYERDLVERISGHFIQLMQQIIDNEQLDVGIVTLLSDEEKKRILCEFNNTDAEYPRDKTIHELFAEQVARTPGNIAIVSGNIQIAYGELRQRANQLSYYLKEKGMYPDTIVAILAERSIEGIIGIWGTLISGGAYLPIDPDYPAERIKYMLAESNAKILLSDRKDGGVGDCPVPTIDLIHTVHCTRSEQRMEIEQDPLTMHSTHLPPTYYLHHSVAYIIYTSGTTGKPKGTLITHRNVVRLLFNERFQFDFDSSDTWTQFHSYCFDFSVWEIYGALLSGAKLRLIPRIITVDTWKFLEILVRERVTVLNQTPSAFYNLLNLEVQNSHKQLCLKYVIFGGEALKPLRLQQWKDKYPQTKLINMYGITETTVHVTYKEVEDSDIRLNISNIGQPIPTLNTYIIGRGQQLLPVGLTGEICVGGEGVARGYLNRPELTCEKFVGHPYIMGQRLYRSGDSGRFLENGDIEYLGRIDHQIKIRGFRIEPGEVENQLLRHEAISDAAASSIKNEDGELYLCAYIVAHREILVTELKEFLLKELPAYMIPSYFIQIDKMPLTPNGKLDQKALQSLGLNPNTGNEFTPPENKTEELIAAAWKEVLHDDNIGVNDNFFDVGGHSLNLIRLNNKLNQAFQKNIPMVVMFRYPTIRSLARYVDDKKTAELISDEKIDRSVDIMEEASHFFFGDSD